MQRRCPPTTSALKILCERGLKDEALATILERAKLPGIGNKLITLRVLGLLIQNGSLTPRRSGTARRLTWVCSTPPPTAEAQCI